MPDPFFQRIHDSEWNACVGIQGDELNYVDGFLEAARIIADALIDGELTGSRDTLIMPILYNVRHGLELSLKFVIGTLARAGIIEERSGAVDHDIRIYWEHLHSQQVPDHRARKLILALEPFVASLDTIDKDGGELRYFETKDGRRSLGEHSVVHLKLVRANVHRLGELLHELTDRIGQLEIDWPTGTFTDLFSRSDLLAIAKALGPRATWTEESFDERRDAVKAQYGVGARPLTKAIEAIERSRHLGVYLGKSTPLKHLTHDRVIQLVGMWLAAHPPRKSGGTLGVISSREIRKLLERGMPAQMKLDQTVMAEFSFEEFADVETVFYVGTVPLMGEQYEAKLQSTLAEHLSAQKAERDRWHKVHHIMSKTNFLVGMMRGLERTGSPCTAAKVKAMIAATNAAL